MNVLAVCAGACGLELGLRLAGEVCGFETRTVCYVEREAFAAANLVAKIEAGLLDQAPIWSELATFRGGRWRGRVDCITAGIPCQPYSTAGKRRGDEDERAIWPEFVRVVGEIRPTLVFIENVPTFVAGGYFRPVGERLSAMGYGVEKPLFLAAEDLGASHKRERVWIMAHNKSLVALQQNGICGWQSARAGGEELAHAERVGSVRRGGTWRRRCRSKDGNGELVNTESQRSVRTLSTTNKGGSAFSPVARTGLSVFPPGPGERDKWGEILQARPELAPAVDDTGKRTSRQHIADDWSANREGDPSKNTGVCMGNPIGGRQQQSSNQATTFRAGRTAWDKTDELCPSKRNGRCEEALEPAIRGVADGMADRVDRLRLCGNGVVPVVAAYAFITLAREAGVLKGGI